MNQCPKPVKAKVRVRKWLEIEELERYEQFVRDWHSLLTRCRQGAGRCGERRAFAALAGICQPVSYTMQFSTANTRCQ